MVYFQTKNTNLGKFLRLLQWKMLVYNMAIRSILGHFGKFLVYLWLFGNFFPFWYVVTKKICQP
jgi:hypothetical protein